MKAGSSKAVCSLLASNSAQPPVNIQTCRRNTIGVTCVPLTSWNDAMACTLIGGVSHSDITGLDMYTKLSS